MRNRKVWAASCLTIVICLLGTPALWWGYSTQRSFPIAAEETLFQGVTYDRVVWTSPRNAVIHVVTIDLDAPGIQTLVTPGDPGRELPLYSRTTSEFMDDFGVQIAINGDFFQPWDSTGTIFNYYPRSGDPVEPLGYAASEGIVYASPGNREATLYLSPANKPRFFSPIGNIHNAISGYPVLLRNGNPSRALNDNIIGPRTAIGINSSGRFLILIVVDGRQPGYSEGVTLAELAEIFMDHGGNEALNLDGGGSSTLVMEGRFGPIQLNRPIDKRIPGRERSVGNHFGIYAKPIP